MNNKYQTIVFGGNNPIFIPGMTNELKYDEIYINENYQSLDVEKKLTEFAPDVNFMKNLEDCK